MLPKNLPKIFRWPEMCPLDKILAQDFQMAAFTKILGRRNRQYYPRKLLGPWKSGMGRGLRPSVASLVERTPAARPLLSVGRASGSTSGSASRGGWAAEIFILLPRDFGSSYLFCL